MKLKLKEEPGEWRKFALVWCGVGIVVSMLLRYKAVISTGVAVSIAVSFALVAIMAWIRPSLFRGAYRAGMTVSFHIGRVMGTVILGAVYLFVVTPMGLLLRLFGKDLLELKLNKSAESYWKPARKQGQFEQQF